MNTRSLSTLAVAVSSLTLGALAADPTPTPNQPRPTPTPTPTAPASSPASVTPTPKPTPTNLENTGRNVRDRQPGAALPTDQSNRAEDLKATQDIRKAVMADKTLSVNGKNAKIITTETSVVLRGPVNSAEEKSKIGDYAKASAGSRTVANELEVQAK